MSSIKKEIETNAALAELNLPAETIAAAERVEQTIGSVAGGMMGGGIGIAIRVGVSPDDLHEWLTYAIAHAHQAMRSHSTASEDAGSN